MIIKINNKEKKIAELPNPKDTIAGAGHKPTIPHPVPNNADPIIRRLLIFLLFE